MKQVVFCVVVVALAASGQGLKLRSAYAGSRIVTGEASPGSGPITIYDISKPAKVRLGTTKLITKNGRFGVPLKPGLSKDERIIAVDARGNESAPVVVTLAPAPRR